MKKRADYLMEKLSTKGNLMQQEHNEEENLNDPESQINEEENLTEPVSQTEPQLHSRQCKNRKQTKNDRNDRTVLVYVIPRRNKTLRRINKIRQFVYLSYIGAELGENSLRTGKGIHLEAENFWLRKKAIEAITGSIQLKDAPPSTVGRMYKGSEPIRLHVLWMTRS